MLKITIIFKALTFMYMFGLTKTTDLLQHEKFNTISERKEYKVQPGI